MPQVAAETELAPGTLYLYFPGKAALYAELALEGYELLSQRLESAAADVGTPQEVAERLADAFLGFATETPEYYDMIFFILQREGAGWEGNLPDEQVGRLRACESRCLHLVADIAGQVRPEMPEDRRVLLANTVWSMLAGVIFYFKDKEIFPAVAALAKGLLLRAVFPEQSD